jgi:hypothetical protein
MQSDIALSRYRQVYAWLLRFYPKPYRERFEEGMGQVFSDLCRERTAEGKGLFTFVLWMFSDTFIGVISTRISYLFSFMIMHSKHILRPAIITALILMIPFIAMQFTSEVNWTLSDFIVMGVLIFGVCLAYELVSRKVNSLTYRLAVAAAVLGMFLIVWVNLAVGIIGDEPNGPSALYFVVPLVAILSAIIARLEPTNMSRAMGFTTLVLCAIPLIGFVFWRPIMMASQPEGIVGAVLITLFFSIPFVASSVLFREASLKKA